jgi:hypothetical protein
MSRLHIEFRRLFLAATASCAGDAIQGSDGVDAEGRVRALVIQLARPADWQPLADVWMGVQTELGLPAPAIAVNGADGMQLWFSVAVPLDTSRARSFLNGLRLRYLAAVKPDRLALLTGADPALATCSIALSGSAGATQEVNGCWPAFVAPDLAPIFAETPWLDLPPGDEGQSRVLGGLQSIKPALFDAALAQLQAWAATPATDAQANATAAGAMARHADAPHAGHPEAQRFLLTVMNDGAAPLALRIEAAKALLPFGERAQSTH